MVMNTVNLKGEVESANEAIAEVKKDFAGIDHVHDEACIGGKCTSNVIAIDVLNGDRNLIADCTVKFPTKDEKDELEDRIAELTKKLEAMG